MKKIIFFLFLAIVLASCDACGDINPPEPPPVQKFTITWIVGPNGSITPSSAIVVKGQSASFTPKPDLGYLTECIKHNGDILPPVSIYTVSNVTKNDTFEVTFKKDSVMFPLLRIKWLQNHHFSFWNGTWTEWNLPDPEGFSFNPDGTYVKTYNGTTSTGTWSLDRSVSPMILKISGFYPFTVETINEKTLSIYCAAYPGAIIDKLVFGNVGYK